MSGWLVMVIGSIMFALLCWGAVWIVTRERKQEERYECYCGKLVSENEVHRVIETPGDDREITSEAGSGGGTVMIAEFCEECCPGGICNRGEPSKDVA